MRNCIRADIRRVQSKRAYFICILLMALLIIFAGFLEKNYPIGIPGPNDSSGTFGVYSTIIFLFFPFLVGIPIYSAIFSDDFRSRSMQIAIGFGLTRKKLILSRFQECLILLIETGCIFSLVLLGSNFCFGLETKALSGVLVNEIWVRDLKILAFLSISMILVYGTQKSGSGLVLFILLLTGIIEDILSIADMIPFMARNHISIGKYLPSNVVSSMSKSFESGDLTEGILYAAGFAAGYILLPILLSICVFRKKELDF